MRISQLGDLAHRADGRRIGFAGGPGSNNGQEGTSTPRPALPSTRRCRRSWSQAGCTPRRPPRARTNHDMGQSTFACSRGLRGACRKSPSIRPGRGRSIRHRSAKFVSPAVTINATAGQSVHRQIERQRRLGGGVIEDSDVIHQEAENAEEHDRPDQHRDAHPNAHDGPGGNEDRRWLEADTRIVSARYASLPGSIGRGRAA